jgi:sialate O-acetylesterase
LPAPGDKVKLKGKHAYRFTAVKDARNRKVRGLWRRGRKWCMQTKVSGEKSARRAPHAARTLEAAKAEMADLRRQKRGEGLPRRTCVAATTAWFKELMRARFESHCPNNGIRTDTLQLPEHPGLLPSPARWAETEPGTETKPLAYDHRKQLISRVILKRYLATSIWLFTMGIPSPVRPSLFANVEMPRLFGDNMVLQASSKDAFWGTASPGEEVTVTVGGATASTRAGKDGKWKALVDVPAASTRPISVTVHGQNTLTFQDVLLGEVWLASGQSNMEMGLRSLQNGAEEIKNGNHPLIHVLTVPFSNSFDIMDKLPPPTVQDKQGSSWQVCDPGVLEGDGWNGFSGVAYYFGREIQERTGYPVGIIVAAYHGQSAQGFISLAALEKDIKLARYVDDLNEKLKKAADDRAGYPQAKAEFDRQMAEWDRKFGADYKKALADWSAAKAAAGKSGLQAPPMPNPPAPRPKNPPDGAPTLNIPTTSYNAMIHPLIPYGIRGVIWYQGESNASFPWDYDYLMGQLIKDWRIEWERGDFPFYFVQLCTLGKESLDPGYHGGWPLIREMQTRALSVSNTGMAVTETCTLGINRTWGSAWR